MHGKDLENNQHIYDSIIIGGGIVGAGLFREQALHNLDVLILDQADFNSQTSQGSSKMLHGGIRYLEQLDFFLVFEALKEKNIWLKLTPHIAKEMPLYLPVYKHSKWPKFALKMGLLLYDILSLFQNTPHKMFSKIKTLEIFPSLKSKDLKGSGMYYDGVVDDAKLGLECIYDALTSTRAKALNYKKVVNVHKNDQKIFEVQTLDTLTSKRETFYAKVIQFATGPFTDKIMKDLNISWDPVLLPSKGSHLWLKKDALNIKNSMVLQTKDGRIIFVIPSRESILVGTTEVSLKEDEELLNIKPSKEEIQYLLDCVNEYFPSENVTHEDILSSFAAVRPLVKDGTSRGKTSRKHKIFSPMENMYVIVGGKYTTFRKMAEDLNKKVFKKLNIRHDKSLTLRPLQKKSVITSAFETQINKENIEEIMKNELVRTKEDLLVRRLSVPSENHLDPEAKSQLTKIDMKDQCE